MITKSVNEFVEAIKKNLIPKGKKITVGVSNRTYKGPDLWNRAERHITTTQVGAAHEFGLAGVPKRSFLKMPLELKTSENVEEINSITWNNIDEACEYLAELSLGSCVDAFKKNGYGHWQKLSEDYEKRTGRGTPILDATGQLKSSLFSRYRMKKFKAPQEIHPLDSSKISARQRVRDYAEAKRLRISFKEYRKALSEHEKWLDKKYLKAFLIGVIGYGLKGKLKRAAIEQRKKELFRFRKMKEKLAKDWRAKHNNREISYKNMMERKLHQERLWKKELNKLNSQINKKARAYSLGKTRKLKGKMDKESLNVIKRIYQEQFIKRFDEKAKVRVEKMRKQYVSYPAIHKRFVNEVNYFLVNKRGNRFKGYRSTREWAKTIGAGERLKQEV